MSNRLSVEPSFHRITDSEGSSHENDPTFVSNDDYNYYNTGNVTTTTTIMIMIIAWIRIMLMIMIVYYWYSYSRNIFYDNEYMLP